MSRARILIVSILVSFLCFAGGAIAQSSDDLTIQWPSREFPTIQSALNALPDGGVLEIAEGEYFVEEPIYVTGRSVTIKGAGSGLEVREDDDCRESRLDDISDYSAYIDDIIGMDRKGRKGKEPVTRLMGPPPQPVVDERGNLVLRAEAVEGMFNFMESHAVVSDMKISGFDAGIVIKGDNTGEHALATITNVDISDTGRGILSLLSDQVTVANTVIRDTLWNGISVVGKQATPQELPENFVVYGGIVLNTNNAGIFLKDTGVCINNVLVFLNGDGGILAYDSVGFITNSAIIFNRFAGIALFQCPSFTIMNNRIKWSKGLAADGPYPGKFGDGITLWLSQNINVIDNLVSNSDRAGLSNFGSFAALANNRLRCAGYEL